MLGERDDFSVTISDTNELALLGFINETTKQIDTKSLVKFAQTSKTNLIMVGEVLGSFLLTNPISHADSVMQARENISNFIKHPEYRKPEWLLSDQFGKNHVFKEVVAERYDDPISKILRGEVTPEQQTILNRIAEILASPASVFSFMQKPVLESRFIKAYIASGQLTIKQAHSMRWEIKAIFENVLARAYIASGQLTIEQVHRMGWEAKLAFVDEHFRVYLTSGQISLEQVLNITSEARAALKNEFIRVYIAGGQLTIKQVIEASWNFRIAFENEHVRGYIASGQLRIEQLLSISLDSRLAFENEHIRAYIASGKLTCEQVLSITQHNRLAFENKDIRALIASSELTPVQVLNGDHSVLGSAHTEALLGGGSGAADYHSLSTSPLLSASISRERLEATTELEKK